MKKKVLLFIFTFALMIPFAANAAGSYTYDVAILPESVESILELINLLISVFAAAFALKLAALSQGGSLEKTWNKLAIAAVLFALFEVVGALKGFKLVHVGGLGDMIEFIFVLILAGTFYKTRKQLLKATLGK